MDGAPAAPVVAAAGAAASGASASGSASVPDPAGDVPLHDAFPHLADNGHGGGGPGDPSSGPDGSPPAPRKSRWKLWLALIGLLLIAAAAAWAVMETRTSRLQSKIFADMASELTFRIANGPSDSIRFPAASPYDTRLGYAGLPKYLERLQTRDYAIASQARISPQMVKMADLGLYATYHEKTKVGLEILDCRAQPLFTSRFPERYYDKFDAAPSLLVQSLLFIENRELLDASHPRRNPAVEWDRFSKAVFDKTLASVGLGGDGRVAGGSTLATQIEKYRH